MMGEPNTENDPKLMNCDLLKDADVVITIGKTVQYCLVSGTPVYVYDHYGGVGFLNDKNYEVAKIHNFSGREARRKSGEKIAAEIMNKYEKAFPFYGKRRDLFKKDFLISNVLPKIFEAVKPVKVAPFSEEYLESILLSQNFAARCFQALSIKDELNKEVGILREENEVLREEIANVDRQLTNVDRQLTNVLESEAWKIGKAVTCPLAKIKKLSNKNK